jgi:cytochrome oxidase Cu insertion factor (SCO1/SenC/PrrC family)
VSTPAQHDRSTPHAHRRVTVLLWSAAGLAVALSLAAIVAIAASHPLAATGTSGTTPVEPGIGPAASVLLQLDILPPPQDSAPDFALTDQHARPTSISQYRGKAVVLSFNDDVCQDLCTLLAQDVAAADADLGAAANNVVFLSVNVNPLHPSVKDVLTWTDSHALGGTANWVFATGTAQQLARAADQFHVPVTLDPKTHEVVHGTELFFIDPAGREAALGQFGTQSANTALFAHAMAQMAVDLLPTAARSPVTGPSDAAAPGTVALNSPAPSFTLPQLNNPATDVSLARTRGKYTVVNFWASTCSACLREMPDLQTAHRTLGDSARFVGIDVADPAGPAAALAKRSGVTYLLLADVNGTAAGAYRIPGLPFTAIIGPDGNLLVRHPGTFSAEQLEYIIATLQHS